MSYQKHNFESKQVLTAQALNEIEDGVVAVTTEVSGKLDKNHGAANVGKILAIGTDGNVVLTDMPEGGDIVGVVDESNNILLQGVLPTGTYTLKYENEDGTYSDVGTIIIGSIPVPDDPEPTLTNLIPLSTDASGNPYVGTNGEDGYKEGYKVSVTSGGESAAAGYKITGFMPVTYDDTLYFSGISFEASGTNTNFCCYDSSRARIGGNNWCRIFTSGVNGQVVSIAVKDLVLTQAVGDLQDVAFIRISASVIDENSIVTVNEPIE